MKRALEAAAALLEIKRGRKAEGVEEGAFAVMDQTRVKLQCSLLHPPETRGAVWRYAGKPSWCPFCGQCTASVQWERDKETKLRHCMGCAAPRV